MEKANTERQPMWNCIYSLISSLAGSSRVTSIVRVNEHMLLVLKTRLCFVAFASHASAKFGIVPNGCPPSSQHKTGQAVFTPFNALLRNHSPAKNARLSLPLFGWQMVTVRVCSAWPWLITENRRSCLPLYQALPRWSTQATSCCPHGTSIWELYHGTQCLLFVLTWSSQALRHHMLTNNLYSYWVLFFGLWHQLFETG